MWTERIGILRQATREPNDTGGLAVISRVGHADAMVPLDQLCVRRCPGCHRYRPSWIAAPGVDPSTVAPYNKAGVDPTAWEAMRSFRSPFVTVHYWTFYALLFLIAIHIVGVVVTELREGGGIVSAMFTGRKVFARKPADDVGGRPLMVRSRVEDQSDDCL